MNHNLNCLEPYPFEKLNALKKGRIASAKYSPINMSIGEPKHAAPEFVLRAINENRSGYSNYPVIKGSPELRQAIVSWLNNRFKIKPGLLDSERHVIPVNGTREALFSIGQCIIDNKSGALVLMPNPFLSNLRRCGNFSWGKAVLY